MTPWILSLLLLLAPSNPHRDRFPEVAAAVEKVAREEPVYPGDDGPSRTAAELVAVAYYESSFDPSAVRADAGGDSVGLGQVNVSNLAALGVTRADLLDPEKNLRAAARLMRASHRTCRGRPALEGLAQYASGGPSCTVPEGLVASRRRLGLAQRLLRDHPPRWVDRTP